jgi:hypothetical protein
VCWFGLTADIINTLGNTSMVISLLFAFVLDNTIKVKEAACQSPG